MLKIFTEPIKRQPVIMLLSILIMCLPGFAQEAKTTVRFKLMDTSTNKCTPAMVCITNTANNSIHLPPDGKECKTVSQIELFGWGIQHDGDHNWIGPVRKTMGMGNNNDRSIVYQLKPSVPYWKEPVMYQVSGDFTIDLLPGRWRIAVEHGMEYIPVVEEFTIKSGDESLTKTIKLKRWIDLPEKGWFSGDIHVHHPILNEGHREFLLHYAMAEDLHIVNILTMGHHTGVTFNQLGFGKKFRVRRGDYCLISGQEEPRSQFGHIIGLNIESFVRNLNSYDFYDTTFRDIHKQKGALVGFAHFAWSNTIWKGADLPRGFPWYVTTEELDFIELLQYGCINTADYYDYLNLGFKLTAAAGTDVPWGSTIGEVRTYVYTGKNLDVDAWFAGLEKGNTFVGNGPALEFTVDGKLPGTEITKKAGSKVKISATVLGHPKVGMPKVLSIISNDGVVKEIINDKKKTKLTVSFDLPITTSRWLVAGTICDNNAVAHSTPVYVIVNGRRTWCPERGPAVIDKQLAAIAVIEREVAGKDDDLSKGVRQRLQRAKDYYAELRKKMSEVP